ncbi:hypothetical protein [Actinoplanes siamensis]|uniref:Uncharacterized protein n=1 Tax=Actinoplanes siamensis TaxID=1223317 RepID=A0A919TJ71_9ACTN|nr:hypothetical protein [Actinoplanes siamensis]GIF04956.1 hypothetical protein Asi03nite_24940 [Actinoplanes siamensis]
MESTYSPQFSGPQLAEPAEPEQSGPAPAVPALIFLESADDAGICDVDGVCD